ncbi:SpoIID/LytB domain-containing protein [Thermaerobacter sp. PB12/4term]|uniref:SpoIID/LytB domain-containing protein n=1 Tax=Thermaerobacter sp. PB12/4term TaxID=2293838 RepID=UPI0011C04FF1|nr:SpoIID/LytB domain-containing protein [Thermaerobacter sp. PB12/4term]QIA26640.1 SpoIID/LytB domain-containing protein [Thermaerobacter sp. PB12/4term]
MHEVVVPPGTREVALTFEEVPGETSQPRVGPVVVGIPGGAATKVADGTAGFTLQASGDFQVTGTNGDAASSSGGSDSGTNPDSGGDAAAGSGTTAELGTTADSGTTAAGASGEAAGVTATGSDASATGASATATSTQPNPITDWVRFFGGGYGHRTGMSQRGAEGLGRLGVPYRDILAHYYPGAQLVKRGTADTGQQVRVGLSLDENGVQSSAPQPRLMWVVDVPDGAVLEGATAQSLPAGSYRVTFDTTVGFRWQSLTTGGPVVELHGKPTAAGSTTEQLDLVIPQGKTAQLHYPQTTCDPSSDHAFRGCRDYEGRLEFEAPKAIAGSNAGITVRNKVNLFDYLVGVVPHESPASWSVEALKAQAVAARTYAARQNFGLTTNLVDSTYDQVFYGRYSDKTYRPKIEQVVKATDAQVLMYNGVLISANFTAGNGGYVASNREAFADGTGEPEPYLRGREDRFVLRDGTAITPEFYDYNGTRYEDTYFRWRRDVSRTVIEKLWPEIGTLQSIEAVERNPDSMTPRVIRISGTAGQVDVLARVFRSRVGLPSAFLLPDKLYPRQFPDVTTGDLAQDVNRAYQAGLVDGDLWARFYPNETLTRGAFAKMIVEALERLKGGPLAADQVPAFPDVKPDQAFYLYIVKAYTAGIISGYPDGTFGYEKPIKRQEAALILQRAFKLPSQPETFPDVPDNSDFAGAIGAVSAAGIMKGISTTRFAPGDPMMRAMAAAVAVRGFEYCWAGNCQP